MLLAKSPAIACANVCVCSVVVRTTPFIINLKFVCGGRSRGSLSKLSPFNVENSFFRPTGRDSRPNIEGRHLEAHNFKLIMKGVVRKFDRIRSHSVCIKSIISRRCARGTKSPCSLHLGHLMPNGVAFASALLELPHEHCVPDKALTRK